MFQKLFKKIDEFIENFSEITNLDQVAMETLEIITQVFKENKINEEIFDKIMQQEGLLRSIGNKLKKSLKNKEELLKQLLYICTIMNEFNRRYKIQEKSKQKDKVLKEIIEKYSKYIKEVSESKNISQEDKNKEIKKLRKAMEKEIKNLELQPER